MIDASKGFDNQDKNIIRYIIDKGKGLMILVNKFLSTIVLILSSMTINPYL